MIQPIITGRGVRPISQPPMPCPHARGRRVPSVTDPLKSDAKGQASGQSLPEATSSSNALALRHSDLVRQMALAMRRRLAPGASVDDLVGAGNLGLVEAARRFDPSKASFGTFARYRIRGAMTDSLRAIDPLSRQQRSRVRKVNVAIESLSATLGRTPFADEIAKHLGISLGCWERMSRELCLARLAVYGQSANQMANPEDLPTALPDPEQHAAMVRLRELLNDELNELSPRHKLLIRLYYFSGWPMKRIAAEYGVTEGRASQIHRSALVQLRTQLSRRSCRPSAI